MILQHSASTTQDLKTLCETIWKVQQLANGPGNTPCADGLKIPLSRIWIWSWNCISTPVLAQAYG